VKSLESAFRLLPDTHQRTREGQLRRFLEQGFPTKREEDWRYTDLSPLAEQRFRLAQPHAPRFTPLDGCELLAFANGRFGEGDASLAGNGTAPEQSEAIPALNAAFAESGLTLEVAKAQIRPPLHVMTWFGGETDSMAHLRHRIVLRESARATVVLQELGDDVSFFVTQVMDIELGPGSRLDLIRLQSLGDHVTALNRTDVHVGAGATFNSISLDRGGALVRHDLNISLSAPGAATEVNGVMLPHESEHLDIHTRIHHRAPHGTSREAFRAIARDRARVVFNGKIIVHPDAQKTDSEQHVDGLLLSPGAQINAKPELEIYADDVKCAHGATCGQLDENAIYYLRSRGVDETDARNLLVYTFANDILKRIGLESARQEAERLLLSRMPEKMGSDSIFQEPNG
jgi:Fe-S cluster assembly protein SufD